MNTNKDWLDIASAPKDGTRVLLWNEKFTAPCSGQFYGFADWKMDSDVPPFTFQPTHWMPLPAAPGSPASTQTDERDWELACDNCNGSGHVFVERQVAELKTDVQEFKETCECCDGRGFLFAFEDIPGIAEYVKSCRPASTVATEGEKDERGAFEAWHKKEFGDFVADAPNHYNRWLGWQGCAAAPAAGDALDGASLLNIRFTPVSEGLPELVEYSSSYGGQWSSDWCAVITTRGHIEHTRLVVPGSRKNAPEKGQFYGTWRAGMDSTRVVAWAYLVQIRSAADAAFAQQSQRKEA